MTAVDIAVQVSSAIRAGLHLIEEVRTLWKRVAPMLQPRVHVAYENLLIELVLEIQDRRGIRAVLERRQRVRFLADEGDVVRELAWGEGDLLAHYRVRGAKRLMVRSEGAKRAVLLGLPRRPAKGEQVTLRSRRLIRAGFLESCEYWETWFERPTQRVAMTVIFPRRRPPVAAEIVTLPRQTAPKRVPIRHSADGRAYVRWSANRPDQERTYSLRWTW